jgi:hypothetical protein
VCTCKIYSSLILHDISFIYNRTIVYIESNKWLHNEFCIIHCYKNSTIVITNWLTVTKYLLLFFKGNISFPFYVDLNFVYYWQEYYQGWLWETQWGSYKTQEQLILRVHLGWPSVFSEVRVPHLFCLLCYYFFSICVLTPMLPLTLDFLIGLL